MQKLEGQTINFYGINPKTCNAHHLSHDTYPTGQRNAIFGMTESLTYPLCQQTRISLQSVILTVLMIKNTIDTNPHYIGLCTTIYIHRPRFSFLLLFCLLQGLSFWKTATARTMVIMRDSVNCLHCGLKVHNSSGIVPLAIASSFLVCVCKTRGMVMML